MAFSKDSRDFLVNTMGEDWVKAQEADQKEQADRLRALGVEYKSTAEREEEAEKVKATPQAEPAAQFEAAFKGVTTQLSDLASQLSALTTAVTAVKGDVDTLKKSDKERIDEAAAEIFKTRAAAPAARPTEDQSNVLALQGQATKDTDPQRAADSWLLDMVKNINFGADSVNGGVGTPAAAAVTVSNDEGAAE